MTPHPRFAGVVLAFLAGAGPQTRPKRLPELGFTFVLVAFEATPEVAGALTPHI